MPEGEVEDLTCLQMQLKSLPRNEQAQTLGLPY